MSETLHGREEASEVIWPALAALGSGPPAPSKANAVRKGAAIRWLVGLTIAAALMWGFERPWFALVVMIVASLFFALALVSPFGAHAAVERVLAKLAGAVGTVMSWLLLSPVFYLFMTPFGLIARRGKRDSLERTLEPSRESYWRARDEQGSKPNLDRPF